MAENTEAFCDHVASYIGKRLGIATENISVIPWQLREQLFDQGWFQVLWLCGWPYVDKADRGAGRTELLAAPVPAGARYNGLPVYFSDVVVRRDSPYRSFFDLRSAAWAFNEPRSHSGFNVVRAYLAEISQASGFFGKALESGAHSRSVEMILSGEVAAAAIDSTVLEWFIAQRREPHERLRVVETIGPSPISRVVSNLAPEPVRVELRALLLSMRRDAQGREIFRQSGIERFTEVEDRDYDPIRRMACKAEQVLLA